ncbi:hypothetical protein N782_07460 [Pontibacillus yanchengensis Y32]|uniref:SPOR domain-containing protein n=1 Tax=Pontibacillus yanchengensis Y32 TaxID=1385514 RepID=A0A0A2TG38_9BACI|nr:hypothetical protein N782_07460 [Pontibacillus yanchengensis Y32]
MKTIIIDPGHGGSDPGASYKGFLEKNYNLTIARKVRSYLLHHYQVNVTMTRTSDQTISLTERTDIANSINADYFLSIHNNASGGRGFETFIYNGQVSNQTKSIQNTIHNQVITTIKDKYNVPDRGKKRANFHVLRETKMSAILIEVLFVDNEQDLQLLNNNSFIDEVSEAIAKGTASALNLQVKSNNPLYRVIAGSFKDRQNALQRIQFLKKNNIDSFITPTTISDERYYRVQTGAYSSEKNAKQQVEALKEIGIANPFLLTTSPATPSDDSLSIEGATVLDANQLDTFAQVVNPETPVLGELYVKYGELYGVRGDVAYAQAIHETNYFRFTGIVQINQNNYAGIGATDVLNQGASFTTPEEGVHAHIQHLYAYASLNSIPDGLSLIDPRFSLVSRGSAVTWIGLNGKWAVPGDFYGQKILSIYEDMIISTIERIETQTDVLRSLLNEIKE